MDELESEQEKLEFRKNITHFIRLTKVIAEYKLNIALGIFFMLLFGVLNTLPAIVIKDVVDALTVSSDIDLSRFLWVGFLINVLYLFKGLSYFGQNYTMNVLGQKLLAKLRRLMFVKLIYLPINFYSRATSGKLINRFTTDMTVIDQAVHVAVTGPLRDFPQIIILLGVLVVRSWQLFLVTLIVLPISSWVIHFFANKNLNITSSKITTFDQLTNIVLEVINGIRVVKSNTMEKKEINKFMDANNRVFEFARRNILINSYSLPIVEMIGAVCGSTILVYGWYLVTTGDMTGGDLASYIIAFFMLSQPIKKLNGSGLKITDAIIACKRIFGILDQSNPILDNPSKNVLPEMKQDIHIKINQFSYKDITVLKNIDLKINHNTTIAIVGATGSGKSTLVNLLPRFFDLTPEEGFIKIDGIDIRDVSPASLRSQIAIVTQDMFLFNDTIKFNISCGLERPEEELKKAAKNAFADDFIQNLPNKYDQMVGEKGYTLSGGEKQRISIARALYKDAPILILDEATSHLDNKAEQIVQRAIDNLIGNRTTIIIAHRLSTVKNADIIYFINDGEIVESGTHTELMNCDSEYRRYYEIQFET